jgi:hypothetical protein
MSLACRSWSLPIPVNSVSIATKEAAPISAFMRSQTSGAVALVTIVIFVSSTSVQPGPTKRCRRESPVTNDTCATGWTTHHLLYRPGQPRAVAAAGFACLLRLGSYGPAPAPTDVHINRRWCWTSVSAPALVAPPAVQL